MKYPESERESRFTRANAFCPHPHHWHSADSDSTEYEVLELVAAFVRALQPEIVVETGTAFGFGAEAIGRALRANGHGRLYTFEIDPGRIGTAAQRVREYPVEIVAHDVRTWAPPGGTVDFAFFDSLIDLRVGEFRHLRRFMQAGSIVAFHDAAPHHGLYQQLAQLDGSLKMIRLHTPRGIVFAEVL